MQFKQSNTHAAPTWNKENKRKKVNKHQIDRDHKKDIKNKGEKFKIIDTGKCRPSIDSNCQEIIIKDAQRK